MFVCATIAKQEHIASCEITMCFNKTCPCFLRVREVPALCFSLSESLLHPNDAQFTNIGRSSENLRSSLQIPEIIGLIGMLELCTFRTPDNGGGVALAASPRRLRRIFPFSEFIVNFYIFTFAITEPGPVADAEDIF